jgi:hypothetical protein
MKQIQRLWDIPCAHCDEILWVDHFPHDGFEVVCRDCVISLGAFAKDNEYFPEELV